MNAKAVVAYNIERLIELNGSTQTALAIAIGQEPLSVHLYTKCKRFPKPETLDAICAFFKIPLEELFRLPDKPNLTNEEILNHLASNLGYSIIKKN